MEFCKDVAKRSVHEQPTWIGAESTGRRITTSAWLAKLKSQRVFEALCQVAFKRRLNSRKITNSRNLSNIDRKRSVIKEKLKSQRMSSIRGREIPGTNNNSLPKIQHNHRESTLQRVPEDCKNTSSKFAKRLTLVMILIMS